MSCRISKLRFSGVEEVCSLEWDLWGAGTKPCLSCLSQTCQISVSSASEGMAFLPQYLHRVMGDSRHRILSGVWVIGWKRYSNWMQLITSELVGILSLLGSWKQRFCPEHSLHSVLGCTHNVSYSHCESLQTCSTSSQPGLKRVFLPLTSSPESQP